MIRNIGVVLQTELYLTIARNKCVDIENSEEKSNDINVILIRGICMKFNYLLKINQGVFFTDIGNGNFSLYISMDRYLNINFTN